MAKPKRNVALQSAIFASGKFQRTIAKKAKVDVAKLSHATYGRRALSADEQRRVADVLGMSVEDLFSVAS